LAKAEYLDKNGPFEPFLEGFQQPQEPAWRDLPMQDRGATGQGWFSPWQRQIGATTLPFDREWIPTKAEA